MTLTQINRRLQLSLMLYVSFWLYYSFCPIKVVGVLGWMQAIAAALWGALSFFQVCLFGVMLYHADNSLSR